MKLSSPSRGVFNNNKIHIVCATNLIGDCRNLQDLNISNCKYIDDDIIKIITTGCPTLLYVNMSRNEVSDASIRYLSRYWIKWNIFFVLVDLLVFITRKNLARIDYWSLQPYRGNTCIWETWKALELRH